MKIARTFALTIALLAALVPFWGSAQVTPLDTAGWANDPKNPQADSQTKTYVQSVSQDGGTGANDPRASNFQIVPCTGVKGPDGKGIECDFNMLIVGVNRIIKFLLYLSIPVVVGMILWMGWRYLTAGGDTVKLAEAKKMFAPIFFGLFWIFAGYLVVYTFLDKLVSPEVRTDSGGILDSYFEK